MYSSLSLSNSFEADFNCSMISFNLLATALSWPTSPPAISLLIIFSHKLIVDDNESDEIATVCCGDNMKLLRVDSDDLHDNRLDREEQLTQGNNLAID